ncbi:MAG: DUF6588 family protein [Chlorobiota bacterium]
MMKKIMLFLLLIACSIEAYSQENEINENSVELARVLGKDIFEMNGVPFTQPIVTATNATVNSGFFNTAYIPQEDSLYFKFSVNYMYGIVPDEDKVFSPSFPNEPFSLTKITDYASFDIINNTIEIQDTIGLYTYLLRTLIYDGIQDGSIEVPNETATLLGKDDKEIKIEDGSLEENGRKRIESLENTFGVEFPEELSNQVLSALEGLTQNFPLPKGAGLDAMHFGVPQLEIGSYFGTEFLIRYIPKINYGQTIGDFGFFGVGLKHSISQYFFDFDQERTFDLAIQFAYQSSSMENVFGETNASMVSSADILNFNIQASKNIEGYFDVYGGLSFEQIDIEADLTYTLPIQVQVNLGLVDKDKQTGPGYPGDTKPQTTTLQVEDFNIKGILGIKKDIGPVSVFASYNISKFDIINGGLQYSF